MRQYRVHPYAARSIVDGHPHWAVSSEGEDLIEVGGYDAAIEMAINLAGADAILNQEDVEVIIDSTELCAARRLLFGGDDVGLESAIENEDAA